MPSGQNKNPAFPASIECETHVFPAFPAKNENKPVFPAFPAFPARVRTLYNDL